MWQSNQLDNVLNRRMWEWKIYSALSLLISHFFSTAAKWDDCFLKVQVLFYFTLMTTPFILPKPSFPSTPPSCCRLLSFNIQLRCGRLDFAGETGPQLYASLLHLHHNLDDGLWKTVQLSLNWTIHYFQVGLLSFTLIVSKFCHSFHHRVGTLYM